MWVPSPPAAASDLDYIAHSTAGYSLEKLLGSHSHVMIDVLCMQQINSKQLWIVQTAECEAPFQTVFCWSDC